MLGRSLALFENSLITRSSDQQREQIASFLRRRSTELRVSK